MGYADAVECRDGQYYPVEYKRGKVKERLSGQVQLCAQAMCLEEMTGRAVGEGFIYYVRSRRRVSVPLDPSLRHLTVSSLRAVRELLRSQSRLQGSMPPVVGGAHNTPYAFRVLT